jgi:hypothetical protein
MMRKGKHIIWKRAVIKEQQRAVKPSLEEEMKAKDDFAQATEANQQ